MYVPNEPIVPPPSPPPVDTPPRNPDRIPGEEPLPDSEGRFSKNTRVRTLPALVIGDVRKVGAVSPRPFLLWCLIRLD